MSQFQVLDVRLFPEPQRHLLIFEKLDALEMGQSLVVQSPMVQSEPDSVSLRNQVETLYGDQIEWRYLEEDRFEVGPQVFYLEFIRRAPPPTGWNRADTPSHLHLNSLASTPAISLPTPLVQIDLLEQLKHATFSGPQWGHECEDLDLTLLSWEAGRRIEPHVNEEVDVVWIGLEGTGVAIVNGERHELRPGVLLLVPRSAARGIEAISERFSYLSVHRRRRGLMPTFAGKPLT